MADIIIVPMEQCHVTQVAGLEAQCFSMPWSEKAFADAVESPNYECIAALDGADDSVIGYAGMQVVPDEAEITNIAVNPLYRHRGTAYKLLESLELLCRRKDVKYLHLEVRESNVAARKLYEKFGFEIDGIRKNFYKKPDENAVLMTKFL